MTDGCDGGAGAPHGLDVETIFGGANFREGHLYEAPAWYDLDYAGYKAEEPFYKLLATRFVPRGGAFVELGAGTGRLLLAVAKEGTRAHGVEPAPAMLRCLDEKVAASEVLPGGWVTTEQASGADFEGPDDAPAHVIAFPFNGLLHVHSHDAFDAVLERVRTRLHPDGIFALDITTPAWEEMGLGGRAWGRIDERTHPKTGENVITCDRCLYDEDTRVMHTTYRFLVEGAAEGVSLTIGQFMWTYQEVIWRTEQAGFEVEMVFGDVDFAPLIEKSPRLLLAARLR